MSPGVEELMCTAKWGTGLRPQKESPLAQTGRAGLPQVWTYFSFLWRGGGSSTRVPSLRESSLPRSEGAESVALV